MVEPAKIKRFILETKWLSRKQTPFLVAIVVVFLIAAAHVTYYFPRTVDDMYIFLRYAENLAHGNGLVYNPGERVEGYSSPLWVLLLSVGELIGLGGVSFAKVIAILFFVLLLAGLYFLSREHYKTNVWFALLAPLAVSLNSYVVSWTMWGLETPAYLALLVWSAVMVNRLILKPSRATTIWACVVGASTGLARPEAPFFAVLIVVAFVLQPLRFKQILAHAKKVALPCGVVAAVVLVHFLLRRWYYGHWLPHTFYAKDATAFEKEHWDALWSQGALLTENIFLKGAVVLAVVAALRRVSLIFPLVFAGILYFTGAVILDWMPNQRHFLPIWIFAPLVWAWAADWLLSMAMNKSFARTVRIAAALPALSAFMMVIVTAAQQCQIDSRYSPMDFRTHGRGANWFFVKSREKWDDTRLCLKREMPPHVLKMHTFNMGMVTQLYRLSEADKRPMRDVWYIGRDIGRIGYLSDARIFDTDGLFTPDVAGSSEWRAKRVVSEGMLKRAFNRTVVSTELYDSWFRAARRSRWLRENYDPLSKDDRFHYKNKFSSPPSQETILQRYQYALSKLPKMYYVMTLYGEAVGAAIERRLMIVTQRIKK